MAKQSISVRLEPHTVRLLEQMASDKRVERSTLIASMVKQYTERYAERKHQAMKRKEAVQE